MECVWAHQVIPEALTRPPFSRSMVLTHGLPVPVLRPDFARIPESLLTGSAGWAHPCRNWELVLPASDGWWGWETPGSDSHLPSQCRAQAQSRHEWPGDVATPGDVPISKCFPTSQYKQSLPSLTSCSKLTHSQFMFSCNTNL